MYMIGKKLCPHCGVKGKAWKEDKNIFICPKCNSFFNEFGIILEKELF